MVSQHMETVLGKNFIRCAILTELSPLNDFCISVEKWQVFRGIGIWGTSLVLTDYYDITFLWYLSSLCHIFLNMHVCLRKTFCIFMQRKRQFTCNKQLTPALWVTAFVQFLLSLSWCHTCFIQYWKKRFFPYFVTTAVNLVFCSRLFNQLDKDYSYFTDFEFINNCWLTWPWLHFQFVFTLIKHVIHNHVVCFLLQIIYL